MVPFQLQIKTSSRKIPYGVFQSLVSIQTRFLVSKELTFPSLLTKQGGVVCTRYGR